MTLEERMQNFLENLAELAEEYQIEVADAVLVCNENLLLEEREPEPDELGAMYVGELSYSAEEEGYKLSLFNLDSDEVTLKPHTYEALSLLF